MGVLMLVTHLVSLAIVYSINFAIGIKLLLSALVLASLVDVMRRVVLRHAPNAITAIKLDSNNNIQLVCRSGRRWHVSELRSVFISPVITLISVAVEGKQLPQNLLVPFDAVDREKFRQLRVKLKSLL